MTDLLVKPSAPDGERCILDITPESAGWKYVGFAVFRMEEGDVLQRRFEDREACIVVVSGSATIEAGGQSYAGVGGRESAFDDLPPGAVYVPRDTAMQIVAESGAEVALCTAPSAGGT